MVKRLQTMQENKMLNRQLLSYLLHLESKKLANSTIKRKMTDIMEFIFHLDELRKAENEVTWDNINDIVFTYVRDGYFTTEDLDGSYGYRRSIYSNIRQGMNYIYEDMQDEKIVKELDPEQKEILEEISKNNWFRCSGNKNTGDVNNSIQTQLIEKLGLKVYFDEDNKPYVLSIDLAENIQTQAKHINEKLKILEQKSHGRHFDHGKFIVAEETYINTRNQKQKTYRIYKDMLFLYLMDTTAQGSKKNNLLQWKMDYISAFNFIEEEYNKALEKYVRLKQSFLKMYNVIRKENRNLILKK